jgi:hypothetical protein
MKSPWQIGLLALAVTGVSTYDFVYFTGDRNSNQTSIQTPATLPLIAGAESMNSTPAESGNSTGAADAVSLPHISPEEIHRLAQQAFVSAEEQEAESETESETVWPGRDPFSPSRESSPISPKAPAISSAKETSIPPPLPAPHCVFSGTLIEQEHRLALVNGVPLSIGDRLGVWQLARIEPEYIILEAGKETCRVELKSMKSPNLSRKDPS